MDTEIFTAELPNIPKTLGRKKIKIQRIPDDRNRQVTFLKRKNGLLKKAMELGILCDCEVSVVIFNLNNGKLFEYSSVEPEKIFTRYATYNGPSERRKKATFFDLSSAKGGSNIPKNEPGLAQAAMEAASAAQRRPRPPSKFHNPASSVPTPTSRFAGTSIVNSTKTGRGNDRNTPKIRPLSRSVLDTEHDRTNYELANVLTPRTAENHISSIFGLPNNETACDHRMTRQDSGEDVRFASAMDLFGITKLPGPSASDRDAMKNDDMPQVNTGDRPVFNRDDTSHEELVTTVATNLKAPRISPSANDRHLGEVKAQKRFPSKRIEALNLCIPSNSAKPDHGSGSDSRPPLVQGGLQNAKSDPEAGSQPSLEMASGSSGVFSIPSSSDTPQTFLPPKVEMLGLMSPAGQQERWHSTSQADRKLAERLQSTTSDQEFLDANDDTDSQFFNLADDGFKERDTEFALTTSDLNEFSLPSPSDIGFLTFPAPPGSMDQSTQN